MIQWASLKDLAPDNWQGPDEQGVGLQPARGGGPGPEAGACCYLGRARARCGGGHNLCALEILQWLLEGGERPWLEEDFAVGGEEVPLGAPSEGKPSSCCPEVTVELGGEPGSWRRPRAVSAGVEPLGGSGEQI